MKKLLCIPFAAAVLVAMAGPASAHTPTITAKCDTLTVDLKWYENDSTVTVTIDGQPSTTTFGGDYTETFTGTTSWAVVVDNNGEGYDLEQSGDFEDCTPTTSTPVIELPSPVKPSTVGWFGNDCDTRTAWVQFENTSSVDDRVSVAGHEVAVPAHGLARVNLVGYRDNLFFFGPVASIVSNDAVAVSGVVVDGTGLASTNCTYLDLAVLDRQVEEPTVLAFTGAADTLVKVLAAGGLMLVGAGFMLAAQRRKLA